MNTRQLKYGILQDLDFMMVHEATYKGHKIQRRRGKDEYGAKNNTLFIWNGIRFKRVSDIISIIDKQAK